MTYIDSIIEFGKIMWIGFNLLAPIMLMTISLIFLLGNGCVFAINRDDTRKTVIAAFNIMLSIVIFILGGGWFVWTFKP